MIRNRPSFRAAWLFDGSLFGSLSEYLTHVMLVMKMNHRMEKRTLKSSSFVTFLTPLADYLCELVQGKHESNNRDDSD